MVSQIDKIQIIRWCLDVLCGLNTGYLSMLILINDIKISNLLQPCAPLAIISYFRWAKPLALLPSQAT